ncbi:MAG: hypothetical protein V4850_34715 [Myxococcota bacterium]
MSAPTFPGEKLSRLLVWATVIITVYGLLAAHLPFVVGTPWSTCKIENELGCVLAFHLFEVPVVIYQLVFAWYGFTRLRAATVGTFKVLLLGTIVLNAVFGLFEVNLLLESIRANAPTWELLALTSLVVSFLTGVFVGLFVYAKLDSGAVAAAQDVSRSA